MVQEVTWHREARNIRSWSRARSRREAKLGSAKRNTNHEPSINIQIMTSHTRAKNMKTKQSRGKTRGKVGLGKEKH